MKKSPEVIDFANQQRIMAYQAELIAKLVGDISLEQARWKPSPDTWSILEVINHLYDEEREDFRVRLDIILHQPAQPWPPIHPFAWVTERRYNARDLESSLQNFLEARRASLEWLQGLGGPNWDAKVRNDIGVMRAGDMFASWVVHDQWHIQQLIQLRRAYTIQCLAPYDVRYAGTL